MKNMLKGCFHFGIALLGAATPVSAAELSDADIDNLVSRSDQYVAM